MTPTIRKYQDEYARLAVQLEQNLTVIVNRANSLLDDLRVFSALATAERINIGVIGHEWEKSVAISARLVAIHEVLESVKSEALLRAIYGEETA